MGRGGQMRAVDAIRGFFQCGFQYRCSRTRQHVVVAADGAGRGIGEAGGDEDGDRRDDDEFELLT